MSKNQAQSTGAQEAQVLYAKVLEIGMAIGLLTLLVTFALYVLGVMSPYVPLDKISNYWNLPVNEYLHTLNIPHGWGFLGLLGHGDFINFIGVVILAGITIVCYIAIIPTLLRDNDKVYAGIALAEAVILSLAASGLLAVGH